MSGICLARIKNTILSNENHSYADSAEASEEQDDVKPPKQDLKDDSAVVKNERHIICIDHGSTYGSISQIGIAEGGSIDDIGIGDIEFVRDYPNSVNNCGPSPSFVPTTVILDKKPNFGWSVMQEFECESSPRHETKYLRISQGKLLLDRSKTIQIIRSRLDPQLAILRQYGIIGDDDDEIITCTLIPWFEHAREFTAKKSVQLPEFVICVPSACHMERVFLPSVVQVHAYSNLDGLDRARHYAA